MRSATARAARSSRLSSTAAGAALVPSPALHGALALRAALLAPPAPLGDARARRRGRALEQPAAADDDDVADASIAAWGEVAGPAAVDNGVASLVARFQAGLSPRAAGRRGPAPVAAAAAVPSAAVPALPLLAASLRRGAAAAELAHAHAHAPTSTGAADPLSVGCGSGGGAGGVVVGTGAGSNVGSGLGGAAPLHAPEPGADLGIGSGAGADVGSDGGIDGGVGGGGGGGGAGSEGGLDGRAPVAPLSLHGGIKRSVLKKKRRHGFLRRLETTGGRRVLSKRRIKGRKYLTV